MVDYEGYRIKKLTDDEMDDFLDIVLKAYPVMFPDDFDGQKKQDYQKKH